MKPAAQRTADDRESRTLEDWGVDLSVVIPVRDEADSLPQLYEELTAVLAALAQRSEILFIDDGSRDGSGALLERWARRDPAVGLISLRGPFGKAAALAAGFQHARGQVIVTLDSDLQDDPHEIPRLLAHLENGYDLVSGWKQDRQDPRDKIFFSHIYNFLARKMTRVELHDANCGFKAYRREVVEELDLYGHLHRWIPALARWKHFRVGEVVVHHRARSHGRSKYGWGRLFRGLFDGLTVTFFLRCFHSPSHLFSAVGLPLMVAGLGFETATLTHLMHTGSLAGWGGAASAGAVFLVGGMILVGMGPLAELYLHSLGDRRRAYSIRERLLPGHVAGSPMQVRKRF